MISLLCPTRKRIQNLERMWNSAISLAGMPENIELVLYIDKDDTETINILNNNTFTRYSQITIILEEKKEIYSNLHNICAFKSKYDIIMGAADDIIFRTHNWDLKIIDHFTKLPNDKIGYIYPNDGFNGEKLGTHGFFHKNWINTLGYLSPPIFSVDYSDNYVMELAQSVNRCIFDSTILVEHMHWSIGKAIFDITAREGHYRRLHNDNKGIFESSKLDIMQKDIQKLKDFIERNK